MDDISDMTHATQAFSCVLLANVHHRAFLQTRTAYLECDKGRVGSLASNAGVRVRKRALFATLLAPRAKHWAPLNSGNALLKNERPSPFVCASSTTRVPVKLSDFQMSPLDIVTHDLNIALCQDAISIDIPDPLDSSRRNGIAQTICTLGRRLPSRITIFSHSISLNQKRHMNQRAELPECRSRFSEGIVTTPS
ncbi:hypothetical protein EV702DRAFT_1048969 [Suillus placidus]|uniref:Uncharacterized protein n=1 Tax=Suillus placidus TaxID=48579 RepID=A0A9P6ZLU9_9AGAM|nr:hypothetical protein EV702DRAFT_1048969 [Suillus placidus]